MKSRKYNVKRKNTKRKYTGGKKSKQKYLRKKKSKRKYCGGKKSRWCCNPSRWIIKSRKYMYKKAKQGNNDESNRRNSIDPYNYSNNYSNNNRSRSSKPDPNCPTFSEMIQESEDNSLRRAVKGIYTADEPQKWTKVDKTKKELKEELGENGYKSFKEKIAKKKAERAKQRKKKQRDDRQAIYDILTR